MAAAVDVDLKYKKRKKVLILGRAYRFILKTEENRLLAGLSVQGKST